MERKGQQRGPMEKNQNVAVERSDHYTSLTPTKGKPEVSISITGYNVIRIARKSTELCYHS